MRKKTKYKFADFFILKTENAVTSYYVCKWCDDPTEDDKIISVRKYTGRKKDDEARFEQDMLKIRTHMNLHIRSEKRNGKN